TDSRSCIFPGCASNETLDAGGGAAPVLSGMRPRKYGEPSGATAVSDTRAGVSVLRAWSPGGRGIGSHTKVTFVLPAEPRSVPTQVRITRDRVGVAIAAIAVSTAFGGS